MLRPVSLLPALVAVATLAAGLLVASPASAAPAAPRSTTEATTPLLVTIDSMSPSVVPRKGKIRVSGTVTNADEETWSSISLYAFMGDQGPMTTSKQLSDAATAPEDALVGQRITTEGTYDEVTELRPGESATYSIAVPRAELEPYLAGDGVYWFGVHALGSTEEGGDLFADGRARTFLPLISSAGRPVETAVVIPLRRQILYAPDGSIDDVESWTASFSSGGALRALVDLGIASGSQPVTWLVDPAVIDVARRLEAGNPPRSLASTVTDDDGDGDGDGGGEDGSESPSPSATPTEGEDGEEEVPEEELDPSTAAAAEAAASWLERLHAGLEGNQILALPYGDMDVSAAAEIDPGAYRQARKRATGDLQPWGLSTTPAVSSPTGYLSVDGIQLTDPGTTLLVTDKMFSSANPPAIAHTPGHTLGVTSSGAVSGGPGPDDRRSAVAIRQRIVSEAAVRALTRARKPLLVALPSTWRPNPVDGFFNGLDLPWIDLTSVASALQRVGSEVDSADLDYPETQALLQLDPAAFAAATDLADAGESLQNLLTDNDEVAGEVLDESLTTTSYSDRLRPDSARVAAYRSRAWIAARLGAVHVEAPRAVILSSGSGRFAATVINTLDEPVTVKIQAQAEPPLQVEVPAEPLELGPNARTTVLLNASSSGLGVRTVTLRITDTDDVFLGSSDSLPIRSNRVSSVIWLIIGTGVALLFGAILVRLYRRIRAARA
ncbi:DUF6049 family protein [Nocardioides sp. SR21]|uniref:DUF6049 family protein n=1 Tax=Nocardioides sp. SR21 TaxID=2919501 RepID=UPI001FAA83A0|nr:DUF6049 family protein [Nocardioides sp. SR21]